MSEKECPTSIQIPVLVCSDFVVSLEIPIWKLACSSVVMLSELVSVAL